MKDAENRNPLDDRVARDLETLHSRSRRDVLPLSSTLRIPARTGGGREDRLMALPRFLGSHPRFAVLAGVAVVALAFLLVPFSYEHVVGQEVTLHMAGEGLTPDLARNIAHELGGSFENATVNVASRQADEGTLYTVVAKVSGDDAGSAAAVSEAFARSLREKGYEAKAITTPVKEQTSGSLYAMAFDRTVRVSIDGKTADELEAEITAQLAAAGVPNAQVSVTREGDDHMKIEVMAESQGEPGTADAHPQLILTSDGKDLGAGMDGEAADCDIRLMKTVDDAGEHLIVEVTRSGETGTATVDDPASLSDAGLAAAVAEQLAAQGFTDLDVSADGGRLEILVGDSGLSPQSGDVGVQEKTSWGALKSKYDDN
jgi:hypothetical protein